MDYYSNQELKGDPRGSFDIEVYERQIKAPENRIFNYT